MSRVVAPALGVVAAACLLAVPLSEGAAQPAAVAPPAVAHAAVPRAAVPAAAVAGASVAAPAVAVGHLVVTPSVAAVGESLRVRGRMPRAGAGAAVAVQRADGPAHWRTVARTTADRFGYFDVGVPAGPPGQVRLRAVGRTALHTYALPAVTVRTVRPTLSLALRPTAGGVAATARLQPARADRPVVLQERRGVSWVPLVTAATGTSGVAHLLWRGAPAGAHVLRAVAGAVATVPAASSAWARLRLPGASVAPTPTPVPPPTPAPTPATTPTPEPTRGPPADVVGVLTAGGQQQYVDCRGTGSPTLVLVSGRYGWSKDWADQVGPLRQQTRVCVYDRPSLGSSPSRTGPMTVDAGMHARELAALLTAAGEPGPFVLVGHSYGGLVARSFRAQYPDRVLGIGLLDAVPATWLATWPGYEQFRPEGPTTIDMGVSSTAAGGTDPLARLPLLVVIATWSTNSAAEQAAWAAEQHRVALASSDSLELQATQSGHELQVDASPLVIRAVLTLLDSVRTRAPLPGCPGTWAEVAASCVPRG